MCLRFALGRKALEETISRVRDRLPEWGIPIPIIIFDGFEGVSRERVLAARISARAKYRAFITAGFKPILYEFDNAITDKMLLPALEAIVAESKAGVVIQRPIPTRSRREIEAIIKNQDLDRVTGKYPFSGLCAAAEAAIKLVECLSFKKVETAVLGGNGFVGADIVAGLKRLNQPFKVIEKEDSLDGLINMEVVIAAVGSAHVVQEKRLLNAALLVIDIGFTPLSIHPLIVHGDISPLAFPTQGYVTPVPGGFGPFQMAVLLERSARLVGVDDTVEWKF